MFRIILLTLINLFGLTPQPVRLAKKLTFNEKVNLWFDMHLYELLLIIMITVMIIFVLAILVTIPGTESGVYYNKFNGVI